MDMTLSLKRNLVQVRQESSQLAHSIMSIHPEYNAIIILSPTRELSQTQGVVSSLGEFIKGLRTQLLIGVRPLMKTFVC